MNGSHSNQTITTTDDTMLFMSLMTCRPLNPTVFLNPHFNYLSAVVDTDNKTLLGTFLSLLPGYQVDDSSSNWPLSVSLLFGVSPTSQHWSARGLCSPISSYLWLYSALEIWAEGSKYHVYANDYQMYIWSPDFSLRPTFPTAYLTLPLDGKKHLTLPMLRPQQMSPHPQSAPIAENGNSILPIAQLQILKSSLTPLLFCSHT